MFPTIYGALSVGGAALALDGIPNLTHAYDFSRRVLTSYTGPLIRLRRSTDSVQEDFGYVEVTNDLDVAAIATWLGGASGFFVTVYDQKGGEDVVQTSTSIQPLFVASGQNSKPIARFNGTSQWMRSANSFTRTQPETVFAAGIVTAAGDRTITDAVVSINSFRLFSSPPTFAHVTMFSGAALQNNAVAQGSPFIASCVFNGASSKLVVNGTSQAGNAGANAANGISIGRPGGVGTSFIQGDIFCVYTCNAVLSDANISAVETAVEGYYAI